MEPDRSEKACCQGTPTLYLTCSAKQRSLHMRTGAWLLQPDHVLDHVSFMPLTDQAASPLQTDKEGGTHTAPQKQKS